MNSKYHRDYNRNRYHQIRAEILQRLGGKCVVCGITSNLEVDHIDRNLKSFSSEKWLTVSKEVRDAEIAKCQLLCVDCHDKKTATDLGKQFVKDGSVHGTLSSYRYCKCDLCKQAKSDHNKAYKLRKRPRSIVGDAQDL